MSQNLTEDLAVRAANYLISEANGYLSREQVIIASGSGVLKPGTVLSKVPTLASITAAASAGAGNAANTGTIAMDGAAPVAIGVKAGRYTGVAVDATHVRWEDPDGIEIGVSTHGAAFAKGGIKFTITAGAAANAANDTFFVDVVIEAGDVTYVPFAGKADAILYQGCDATAAAVRRTVTARASEVQISALIWPAGTTANQKTAGLAQLATLQIIAR